MNPKLIKLKLYIVGNTVLIVANSKVTNKFKANAAQKKERNKAASLNINHTKQYCIVLYKVVTSFIPYTLSVRISINKNIKVLINKIKSNIILITSKKQVHKDNPNKIKRTNTIYIKNKGE